MESIVTENLVSFKELEKKIFQYVCELGREITRIMLENYDRELAEGRDKKQYRNKGKRSTTIKTVYGEVTYGRNVYRTKTEDGETAYIYLLDEAMHMDKIGLISTNLAEKIAMTITESPYRVTADTISSTCGQSISAGGVWNLIQQLGERIDEEELHAVRQMDADQTEGEAVIPVLFEEMDGVWLHIQDKKHKKMKKQEMKVFTMYEGWDAGKKNRSTLVGKTMLAGMEKSREFHEKREALIRKKYNADEIEQRILNGDGGSWIKEPYDPDVIFQLDRYHIYQEILRKLSDKRAQNEARELFESEKISELLEFIRIYADSVDSEDEKDTRAKKARELYQYLNSNREGLLPYQKQGKQIPEPKEGIEYRGMGVQESQNCTVITMRMKHRRMRWSESGANHLAKVLCRKENRELIDTIERYTDGLLFTLQMREVIEVLSASKAPKKDGKGSTYKELIERHVPLMDAVMTGARKVFREAFVR